ncbi:MAG: glycosyltransferase [Patescibacteria group bacterium]|jgi:GT2 family glycosyltransferase
MPKFSIIIPYAGQFEMTQNCIVSIRKNSFDFEIIAINNGGRSAGLDCDYIINNDDNLGFPKAVNQGIRQAKGEIIVILNNDTIVTPQWLDRLAAHLEYADMVGPVSNNVSGPQLISYPGNNNPISIQIFGDQNYYNNKLQSRPWYRLVFFCVAIKRAVIDKVGLLDEQFSPGNFEDDDFCLRAIEANFKLVIADDVFIYHLGSQTHKSLNLDYQALLDTNRAKFNAKWPVAVQQLLRSNSLNY